jgi:hypothetical protein
MMETRHLRLISTVLVPLKPKPTKTDVILLYRLERGILFATYNYYVMILNFLSPSHDGKSSYMTSSVLVRIKNQPSRKNVVLLYLLESGMIITCDIKRQKGVCSN